MNGRCDAIVIKRDHQTRIAGVVTEIRAAELDLKRAERRLRAAERALVEAYRQDEHDIERLRHDNAIDCEQAAA